MTKRNPIKIITNANIIKNPITIDDFSFSLSDFEISFSMDLSGNKNNKPVIIPCTKICKIVSSPDVCDIDQRIMSI